MGNRPRVPYSLPIYRLTGRKFPVASVYANSQRVCESIRTISLAQETAFIDTRATLRKEGAKRPIHGPRDWDHFNELGYRILSKLLAARIDDHPADRCDDRWEP